MKKIRLIGASCLLFVATGCMHVNYLDPYTGEIAEDRDFQSEGLLTAALSLVGNGARFSAKLPDNQPPGCFMANQEQGAAFANSGMLRIKAYLQAAGLRHQVFRNSLMISFPNGSGYETDSIYAAEQQMETLEPVATVLAREKNLIVEIAGHADYQGNVVYNRELSKDRAINLARYLASRGIDNKRMSFIALGEDYLSPLGDDAKRVELFICEKPGIVAGL